MNRNWMMVLIAGVFEVGWVAGLKHAGTVLEWVGTVIAIFVSFYLLILSSRMLPVGTVYAVFTGIGTGGTVLSEIIIFGEPVNITKLLLIGVLLCGVVGLKLITRESGRGEHGTGGSGESDEEAESEDETLKDQLVTQESDPEGHIEKRKEKQPVTGGARS